MRLDYLLIPNHTGSTPVDALNWRNLTPQNQLPGYWTLQEIADELGKSRRWVAYFIQGRHGRPPSLKAYRIQGIYLVPEAEALAFIENHRQGQP